MSRHAAGQALISCDGEAAVMTGDAGPDILQISIAHLVAPIRITQELPGDTHAVHDYDEDGALYRFRSRSFEFFHCVAVLSLSFPNGDAAP